MFLDFVDAASEPNILRSEVRRDDFSRGISSSAWYRDQALATKASVLLAAYQLDSSDPLAPGPYLVASDIHLSKHYYGHMVRLCLGKAVQETIFDIPYGKLNSIAVLD